MKRRRLLQLVAKAAATQLASLPAARRADVLEGLALILAGKKDKDLARYTAGLIRLADEHQAKFFEQLTQDGSGADRKRARSKRE
jgi:hypothetical protein